MHAELLVSQDWRPAASIDSIIREVRFASEKKAPPEEKISRHGIETDQFTLTM